MICAKKLSIFLFCVFLFSSLNSFSAILIEQGGKPVPGSTDVDTQNESDSGYSVRNSSIWQSSDLVSYKDITSLRKHRRVSISAMGGGNAGTIGALLDLAFAPEDSALILAGLGNGYNSLGFQWKHIIDIDFSVTPYFTTGLVRWQNAGSMRQTNEYRGQIISKFIKGNENSNVEFGLDFVNATFGLQYTQLSGEYVGLTYFGELSYLFHPPSGKSVPVAGFGAGFYF